MHSEICEMSQGINFLHKALEMQRTHDLTGKMCYKHFKKISVTLSHSSSDTAQK